MLASGLILHMLWAMHFTKAYPNQNTGYAVAGGSNGAVAPKPYWKHLPLFVYAIAKLKPYIVSNLSFFLYSYFSISKLIYLSFLYQVSAAFDNRTNNPLGQGQTAIAL